RAPRRHRRRAVWPVRDDPAWDHAVSDHDQSAARPRDARGRARRDARQRVASPAVAESDHAGGLRLVGAGALALHAAHVRPQLPAAAVALRSRRAGESWLGAHRADGAGHLHLYVARILPTAAGRCSGRRAAVPQPVERRPAGDAHPMTIPPPPNADDRARFRRTLVKVMAMQVVALALLWLLQATFTH